MRALAWIDNQIDKMARVSMWISLGCLSAMVILINVEVVGRFVFLYSTLISDEYSAYLFVGLCFLGFSHAFRKGHFLRVHALIGRLSPQYFKYFHLGSCIIGFVFSLIVTYELIKLPYISYLYSSKSVQASATPLFIPQLILPIGMASITIVFLNETLHTIFGKLILPDRNPAEEIG
jgi:TRAP-type C4-dicarboxylate transport system permease small subunit